MEKKVLDAIRKNTSKAEFNMGWGWLPAKVLNKLGVTERMLSEMFHEVTPSENFNGYNIRWK